MSTTKVCKLNHIIIKQITGCKNKYFELLTGSYFFNNQLFAFLMIRMDSNGPLTEALNRWHYIITLTAGL
jgi:hypothetical protein